jgi:uncharacterized membrane protein YccC
MIPSRFFRYFANIVSPGSFDPKWALFSANSFIAAMLAIYLAFCLGLQRPYWAMLTVYLTAQPFAGAVRSRAVYRFLGTLLGACAALALVPLLVDQPALLSVALTAWAGLCLYISLQDRTPRAYVFMLAGYTATTVAFSSVGAPDMVFDTALSRLEEILLGICCATVVHTLLFPIPATATLLKSIQAAVDDAFRRTAHVASPAANRIREPGCWKLAADITQFEILATHVHYDTVAGKPAQRTIRAVQDHLAMVVPTLQAIDGGLAALGAVRSAALNDLLTDIAAWTKHPDRSRSDADRLLDQCQAVQDVATSVPADWNRLLETSIASKLSNLVDALAAAHALSEMLQGRHQGSTPIHMLRTPTRRARRYLHRDPGLAALSVIALFVAVLGCCAAWIAIAWPDGGGAAQIAAIAAALYSSLDDPGPTLVSYGLWTLASLPIAAVYLFLVFPMISGFPMLVLSLAPTFLVIGYMQANPRHFVKALALGLGLIGALDLQNRSTPNFASFINGNAAAIIGLLAAFLAIRALRSLSVSRAAERLLRHGWTDLAQLAVARRLIPRERWMAIMLDRYGLVFPRLSASGGDVETEASGSLTALQIGLDLLDLRQSDHAEDTAADSEQTELMLGLSCAFQNFATGTKELEPDDAQALLFAIDGELRSVGEQSPVPRQRRQIALTNLRYSLFPNAQAFVFSRAVR